MPNSPIPLPIPQSPSDSSIYFCNIAVVQAKETLPSLPRPMRSTHATSTTPRLKGGKPSRSQNTKKPNLDLTEESLKELNKKNVSSSPYYRGLTDSSLYINSQRTSSPGRDVPDASDGRDQSPGRVSISTTGTTSSISTVLTKIQEWGTSCFKSKNEKKEDARVKPKSTSTTIEIKEVDMNSIETTTKSIVFQEKKPLRERVSKTGAQAPVFVSKRVICVEEEKEVSVHEERTFVWSDKYRPKALEEFICNKDKAEFLHALVQNKSCSHFIFEGRPGVGKRTMVWALLREVFGPEELQTREECMRFELKGEALASINVKVQVSPHHIEINLSELRGYEKNVIIELIKERHNMGLNENTECDRTNCHAIILNGADMLSTDAQLYIRWLMEKTKACNKVFFCCSDASKLQPIRSICKVIQLHPPLNEEIIEVLDFIAEKESIELPRQLAEKMAENSKQNLRQAIRSFEATWRVNHAFEEDQEIMTGWEEDIANIAKNIIEEQSPKQLYVIRGKLQSLIEHNVPAEFIFRTLVEELKMLLGDFLQAKIDALYQEYIRACGSICDTEALTHKQERKEESRENRKHDMKMNVQKFMRIEEFTAKFMSLYKSSTSKCNGESNGQAK